MFLWFSRVLTAFLKENTTAALSIEVIYLRIVWVVFEKNEKYFKNGSKIQKFDFS